MNQETETLLEELRQQYPSLAFSQTSRCYHPRNEDAVYIGRPPNGWTEYGEFVRMQNAYGGADVVPVNNLQRVHQLAAWHERWGTPNDPTETP